MQSCVRFLSGVRTVCRTVASCEPANRFSQIGSSMPAANRRFHSTAYNFSRTDYYHILGVSHAATGDEIKSAYRAKALKLHPDHNRSPSAKEEFAKLSEAYEVLSDAARRQQYNTSSNRSSTQYQYQHQSKSQGSNSNGFNQFHGFEDFRASDAEEFFRNAFREYNFERGFKPERGSHAEDDVYRQYVDDLYGDDADAFSFRERHYPYSARSRSTKRTASRRSRAPKADDFDDFDWDSEANVKVKVKAKRGSKTPTSSQTRPRARRGAVHSERETRESVFGKRFSKTANDNEVKENHANERSQIKVTVKLSFEQAVRGCTKEVLVETRASCSACNGSRNDPGLATKPCKPCQGSGVSRTKFGPFVDRHTCFTCHGVGRVTQRCMRCYGRGFIANRNAVRVNVPAGVADGDAVRSTLRDGQEFSVVCRVAKSDHFVRDGFDVHSDAVVTLAQAALGGTVRVPGLLNHVTVIIPAGTQSHTKICLNGKGVPRLSTQGSGHHYVQIKIRPPTNLTDAQRALLLAFAYKEDRPADSTVEGVVNKEAGTRRTKKSVETSFSAKAESADVKFHDPLN